MVTDSGFWRGKRVFVTGHTGFKGGWLALWLQSLGAEVWGYSLAPDRDPNLYQVAGVGQGLAGETIADIRDADRLRQALTAARPEILFHLAAQAFVLKSYDDPVETFSTNVVGTVALLDALRRQDGVRAAIVISSDKCYENREWLWGYREIDPMGGFDPYSASKGATELAVTAMRRSYFAPENYGRHGVGLASARAGNVVGGGDWGPDRLVPDLLRALAAGHPCVLRHPDAIRPWQHVLEPLSGYMALAEALWREGPAYAEGWNFGPLPEQAKPVGWIADYFGRAWHRTPAWIPGDQVTPHENTTLKLDVSKATARLDWAPRWSLETSLDKVIQWYKAFLAGDAMRDWVLSQIGDYQADPPRRLATG